VQKSKTRAGVGDGAGARGEYNKYFTETIPIFRNGKGRKSKRKVKGRKVKDILPNNREPFVRFSFAKTP